MSSAGPFPRSAQATTISPQMMAWLKCTLARFALDPPACAGPAPGAAADSHPDMQRMLKD